MHSLTLSQGEFDHRKLPLNGLVWVLWGVESLNELMEPKAHPALPWRPETLHEEESMKHSFAWLFVAITIAGCSANNRPYNLSPADSLRHRVTRDKILASGGICNEEDICADANKKQDYDCNDEQDCVPLKKNRR